MTFWDAIAIAVAGLGAGAINAVVGSGTLITFPTLIALGYPPVLANVSNTVGLVPGSAAAVVAYRRELRGQGERLRRLGACTTVGAIVGATLLLTLPPGAFKAIVPVLIGIALLLVILQPRLTAAVAARPHRPHHGGAVLAVGVLGTGIYGGYFGAAQGVLLMGLLGTLLAEDLQVLNAIKNVLALTANLVAAIVFIAIEDIDWGVAGLIAAGSIVGGLTGARIARKLPPNVLRGVIVTIGSVAIVRLLA
ncbi:sulfite exporter TauE/SafE family protein [Sporichthya brevicatena]|uniref:Probable membrane transporter protein n=1 Tax=Sporichthya brevicatena TaxID=171442 RepID=A0ABP3S1W1_9ACTN